MEPTISEFTIMFSIATIGMLVLALAIVFFVIFYQKKMLQSKLERQRLEVEHQQKMLLSTLESQEIERRRIAGDLHDSIGAMLSTIRLSVLTIARNENFTTEGFQQTKKMIDDTIDSVRRISRDLMPSTLEKFGFGQAVLELCDQYNSVSGIKIEYLQYGNEVTMDKSKEIMLFRIVQELLNNAIKHSKATKISILLEWTANLTITVKDDGVGFNYDEKKHSANGLGLFNMLNRARMLGATIEYEPNRLAGTSVQVIFLLAR